MPLLFIDIFLYLEAANLKKYAWMQAFINNY